MKSPITLVQPVLIDLGTRCGTSTTRDWKTISRRIEHEGLSFLTISLANFGEDFQKSLDQGFVGHDQFVGFQRTGGLPRILGGFLDRVFDRGTGRLLEVPCVQSIYAIRQFTLMWSKINFRCSPRRVWKAIQKYLECESEVRRSDSNLISSEVNNFEEFGRVGRLLWAELFSRVDSRIYNESIVPRHGPGATADHLRGNAKYNQVKWTRRLEHLFPHWEHLIPSESFIERTNHVTISEPGDEMPVRVITVPKTLKTPRIIAIEPTCMQYMQQGVLEVIMQELARDDNARELVLFESQEHNQRLAREGSMTGTLATLDLSEASDRVSNQHVRLLVKNHRFLREAIDSTRSRKADIPGLNGVKTIRLAKYASMGSALCFPMESLVFCTLVFLGIEKELNRPLTRKDIKSFYGRVRIYGDDIIVPVDYVQSVVGCLETFGFKVNAAKSFWTGKFRESCGKDYYDGHDVSIVRVRSSLPTTRRDVAEIASTVALRNHLFNKGFEATVEYLDRLIGKIIPFPIVQETSTLLGRHDWGPSQATRHDTRLQIPLVKGVVLRPTYPASKLDDVGALMKFFLKRSVKPFRDRKHLQRSGRPVSVRIKTQWASPY